MSEFKLAVADEFGDGYGRVLMHDLVLDEVGGLTAEQALHSGADARAVWIALCRASDVPAERWYGVGQREPRR